MRAVLGLGKWLLREAVAAIAPVLGGCAAALVGQAAGHSGLGRAVGKGVEDVLVYFGERIVEKWLDCLEDESPEQQREALAELAAMPSEEVRQETQALLDQLDLKLIDADRQVALDYLTAIPQLLSRTLGRVHPAGPTQAADLLRLLPGDVPPYAAPCPLPGTTYRLEALVGMGGFGTVYRAIDTRMPYLPLAIKFRRDASADPVLRRERDNLERLLRADATSWSPRLVRLCGYDLDHATPFLVYEWVPGGDLASLLASRPERPNPDEVLGWMRGIVEGLAFAHRHGIVHRDLKPGNVLMAADGVKVTDFGIGTVTATSATATATLLRGAGTPLYMAPEQRRGAPADPRHDLYSVGVIWFQCLLGDTSADLVPGWEDQLRAAGVPETHVEWIRRCVGPIQKRPADAGALLGGLRDSDATSREAAPRPLLELIHQLRATHSASRRPPTLNRMALLWRGLVVVVLLLIAAPLTAGMADMERETRTKLHNPNPEPTAFFYGVVYPITATALIYGAWLWDFRRRLRRQREQVESTLQMQSSYLAARFPEAVASWGGRSVLLQAEAVELIARELEAGFPLPARQEQRPAGWQPAVNPSPMPERAAPLTQPRPATVLARELLRQYDLHLAAIKVAGTPRLWARLVLGYFGLLAFAMVFMVVTVPPAIAVKNAGWFGWFTGAALLVVGAIIAGFAASWFYRWRLNRHLRQELEKPLRKLQGWASLLTQAFPSEVVSLGGLDALLDLRNEKPIRARLELLTQPTSPISREAP